jgi:hypothetical protein
MPHSLDIRDPGAETRTEQLEEKIIYDRVRGRSLEAIAQDLGLTRQAVAYHERKILARRRLENQKSADEMVELLTGQIQYAMEQLQPEVEKGKPFAVEKWLACIDRLMKLHLPELHHSPGATVQVFNAIGASAPDGKSSGAEYVMNLIRNLRTPGMLENKGIGDIPALDQVTQGVERDASSD